MYHSSQREPENIAQLGLQCVKRPVDIGQIAMSGISESRMLLQLAFAYLAAVVLSGVGAAIAEGGGLSMGDFAAGAMMLPLRLLGLTLALYATAAVLGSSATFPGLLTGVAFLQLLVVGVTLVAVTTLQLPIPLMPDSVGAAMETFYGIVVFVLTASLYVSFIAGALEVGCGAAIILGIVVSWLSTILEAAIVRAIVSM